MIINKTPHLFTKEQIGKIEKIRSAQYVCATEHKGIPVEVFYGDKTHPVSGSRYFVLYYSTHDNNLMIADGSFIEDQRFDAVVSNDGEAIYSRHRHDYRLSTDGSVFIDGGREYTRTGISESSKMICLTVKDGILTEHPS